MSNPLDMTGQVSSRPKPKAGGFTSLVYVLIIIVLAGALGYTYWQYYQTKQQLTKITNPAMAAQMTKQEIADIVAKVKKHMVLPTGEEPVIATIKDAAALTKEQAFYKDAKNGDLLVVYQKAMKAIIYSPTKDLIVNTGPIYVNNEQQTATPAAKATPKATPKATTTQEE